MRPGLWLQDKTKMSLEAEARPGPTAEGLRRRAGAAVEAGVGGAAARWRGARRAAAGAARRGRRGGRVTAAALASQAVEAAEGLAGAAKGLRQLADAAAQGARRAATIASGDAGPDRRRIANVTDFFRYTEQETQKFFAELDRDGDGKVKLDDVKSYMRKRRLPEEYAREFYKKAQKKPLQRLLGGGVTWEEFRALAEEREATMLRVYSSLELDAFGSLTATQLRGSLKKLGLPPTEQNATSMLEFLDGGRDGYVSYGQFRNFLILLPAEKLRKDAGVLWFEAATMVPDELKKGRSIAQTLAITAVAGGLASGTSTFFLHPLDTVKTQVQAAVGKSALEVIRAVPRLGRRGLYRGVIPAMAGATSSHGVRVCIYEAIRIAAAKALPRVAEVSVQGVASGAGTLVGTLCRVPCEVLKQRLQTGQHPNVANAIATIVKVDGVSGLFRGTVATLSREIPFYVLGMVAYEQLKKGFNDWSIAKYDRELNTWQVIGVGGLSGALAAVATTPADVLKTRMMTAAIGGAPMGIKVAAGTIIAKEGVLALFRGWQARALWIAPLGAMNFAGYELAKNALTNDDDAAEPAAK